MEGAAWLNHASYLTALRAAFGAAKHHFGAFHYCVLVLKTSSCRFKLRLHGRQNPMNLVWRNAQKAGSSPKGL
jgi:hypothetical protein